MSFSINQVPRFVLYDIASDFEICLLKGPGLSIGLSIKKGVLGALVCRKLPNLYRCNHTRPGNLVDHGCNTFNV